MNAGPASERSIRLTILRMPALISTGIGVCPQPPQGFGNCARSAAACCGPAPAPGRSATRLPCAYAGRSSGSPVPARSTRATTSRGDGAVGVVAPIDLLAARPGRLALATLAPRPAGIFLQLVGAVQRRRIGGRWSGWCRRQSRRSARRRAHKCQQCVLVEAAAGENTDSPQPARIEDRRAPWHACAPRSPLSMRTAATVMPCCAQSRRKARPRCARRVRCRMCRSAGSRPWGATRAKCSNAGLHRRAPG